MTNSVDLDFEEPHSDIDFDSPMWPTEVFYSTARGVNNSMHAITFLNARPDMLDKNAFERRTKDERAAVCVDNLGALQLTTQFSLGGKFSDKSTGGRAVVTGNLRRPWYDCWSVRRIARPTDTTCRAKPITTEE